MSCKAIREALEKLREPCTPTDRSDARVILQRALREDAGEPKPLLICAGCQVRPPFEHRCHGGPCSCPECACEAREITEELIGGVEGRAVFSPCRTYRYSLSRRWDPALGTVLFIGLNPSTADETQDDPTIRRGIGFAKAWGYGRLVMANLFAYRATDPRQMRAYADPVGPENDGWLLHLAVRADLVIAAWGTHGSHLGRDEVVRELLGGLHCLGLTKDGHPRHPLYLPAGCQPQPWAQAAGAAARHAAHSITD